MPLFDALDNEQPLIGKRDHWKMFEKFEGSVLHELFITEIEPILENETIDSSKFGKEIITKLQKSESDEFEEYKSKDIGGLFGMTLWNYIAQHNDNWYFTSTSKGERETSGTIYWRR